MNLCWNVYLYSTLTLNHCMFLVHCKTNLTMYLLLKNMYIYIYVDIFEQNWKTPTMIVLNCISVSLVLKPQLAAYLPVTQIYRTTYSYCTNHPLFTRYSHSSQGSGFNQKLNIYVYMTTWTYFSILTKKWPWNDWRLLKNGYIGYMLDL